MFLFLAGMQGSVESPSATVVITGLTSLLFLMLVHSAINWGFEWRYESMKAQSKTLLAKISEDEVV